MIGEILDLGRTYPPVGTCIYCGESDAAARLSDEHIIPYGAGGRLILPAASCADCARITSGFELKVLRQMWGFPRVQIGIPSRRPKGQPTHGPIVDENDVTVAKIPIADLPALLLQFLYPYPSALLGIAPLKEIGGRISMAPLRPDASAKMSRLAVQRKRARLNAGGFDSDSFARMLAKIGHAYAVAELGLGSFNPTLAQMILTKDPPIIHHYVGSGDIDAPHVDRLHEIEHHFEKVGTTEYVVVRMRFFARHSDRWHYVVAGVRNADPIPNVMTQEPVGRAT